MSVSTEDSIRINETREPAIVISGSGMANAGRIRHHLRHNLWRQGAAIVFVGFQAEGTPGRKIVDGAKKIRIFNDSVAVAAKVFTINGFSAHAGRDQLLEWLENFQEGRRQVFLVHGEQSAQDHLAGLIRERFDLDVVSPEYLEEIVLGEAAEFEKARPAAAPADEPDQLLGELKAILDEADTSFKRLRALPATERAALARLLNAAARHLDEA